MKRKIAALPILIACGVLAFAADPEFTSDGQLVRPKNYREWIFLSSGLGMTYNDPAPAPAANPNFDNVFVEPSAYRSFLETGRWPDKTIFALELRQSVSKGSINTGGHYQSGVVAVEFAVKDVKRFQGEWGYFGFRGAATTAPVNPPTATCYGCHSKNGAVENTFVQFYPTLLEIARAKGTLKASYRAAEHQ